MAYEALDSLQGTLNRILKQSHHPDINQEIISIHDETVFLQMYVTNSSENLDEQIKEAANTTEEIIEYLFSEENPLYCGWMKPTVEHSKQLREAAEKFKKSTAGHPVNAERLQLKDVSSSPRTATTIHDVVVGLDQDLTQIKNQLTFDSSQLQLQVVSIVGMGGTGKTTLSKLVYNDELIVSYFRIRAWVTVSQDYSVGSIILDLLASLEGGNIPVERDDEHRDISMESLIHGYLMRERFLIVVDDMCSKKAWDDLKMLFPNTNSGSRIMLTTRLHDVAAYVDSNIHTMRLLDAHHSWDLLKKKVFPDESCPVELEDVGKRIVKNCGGVPLSVVVVAGILCKVDKDRRLWKQIAANEGDLETLICLSYNHLPDHLKGCLLYMGGFPEDYEIRVSELIKLWIAEGLLKCPTGSKSLEEEAADCLENLVERSLVLVGSRKVDGKIKSCSLHDIVRDFCVKQGEVEKIILSVMDYLPSPILRKHFLPQILKNHGRISATCHDLDLKGSVQTSFTHSIICIPRRGYRSVGSIERFSSLRVLHVLGGDNDWDWEPGQVFNLIHLTYLASHIPTSIVPPTISKLQNLQTLIIYRFDVCLPVEIWRLRQLRHLIAFSFHPLPSPEGQVLPLEGLQTLSMAKNFVCSVRTLEMIPNVKKLGICYLEENSYEGYHLHNLQHLRRLEKLKLEMCSETSFGASLNYGFPLCLRRLTLSGLRIPWSDMTVVGSLPLLQVLKLRNYACDGDLWETNEEEFGNLQVLLIDGSNLREWRTDCTHFPLLRHLSIHRCPYLSEIPSDLAEIPTNESIEVDDQNTALLESVKRIKLEQEEYGNEDFRVHVKRY